jgi:hypothetical protein
MSEVTDYAIFFLITFILHNLPTMIVYSYNSVRNVCLLNTIFILFNLFNLPPLDINVVMEWSYPCLRIMLSVSRSLPNILPNINRARALTIPNYWMGVLSHLKWRPEWTSTQEQTMKDGWCVAACNNLWQDYTLSWVYNNLSLEVIFLKQLLKIKYFELQNSTSK